MSKICVTQTFCLELSITADDAATAQEHTNTVIFTLHGERPNTLLHKPQKWLKKRKA